MKRSKQTRNRRLKFILTQEVLKKVFSLYNFLIFADGAKRKVAKKVTRFLFCFVCLYSLRLLLKQKSNLNFFLVAKRIFFRTQKTYLKKNIFLLLVIRFGTFFFTSKTFFLDITKQKKWRVRVFFTLGRRRPTRTCAASSSSGASA